MKTSTLMLLGSVAAAGWFLYDRRKRASASVVVPGPPSADVPQDIVAASDFTQYIEKSQLPGGGPTVSADTPKEIKPPYAQEPPPSKAPESKAVQVFKGTLNLATPAKFTKVGAGRLTMKSVAGMRKVAATAKLRKVRADIAAGKLSPAEATKQERAAAAEVGMADLAAGFKKIGFGGFSGVFGMPVFSSPTIPTISAGRLGPAFDIRPTPAGFPGASVGNWR